MEVSFEQQVQYLIDLIRFDGHRLVTLDDLPAESLAFLDNVIDWTERNGGEAPAIDPASLYSFRGGHYGPSETSHIAFRTSLERVKARLTTKAATASQSNDLQFVPATEARDEFTYNLAAKGVAWKTIVSKLKSRPRWEPLNTISSVKGAVERYIARHNLPPLPKRKRGRPCRK